MFSFLSRTSDDTKDVENAAAVRRLPILIIPGFMSSGLRIEESFEKPNWKGKRLWLNIGSLGMGKLSSRARRPWEAFHRAVSDVGSDIGVERDGVSFPISGDEADPQQQATIRSLWLRHMMLDDDCTSERPGVRVRAISGLDGVNYLYPSFLTNMITYVFGPLIDFLVQEGGYTAEKDLQAAPWDWRIPPCEMEARDQYFTKTIQQIEDMYQACGGQTPVVLLGHSLGCNVAHYLLNFALKEKGQAWIDQHIHTYMPVSGTHQGVPKSIKQAVLVDHSCLDPFLTFEEEVQFSRSLGSTAWMFPTQLPSESPPIAWVKQQAILEIRITQPVEVQQALLKNRRPGDRPQEYQLQVVLGNPNKKSSIRLLSTRFLEDNIEAKADFATETFCFVLPSKVDSPQALDAEHWNLQFYLREPGWTQSGKDRITQEGAVLAKAFSCFEWINRILGVLFELVCCVYDIAIFPIKVINQMTVEVSAVLAVSEPLPLQGLHPQTSRNEILELIHVHDSHGSCFLTPHEKRQTELHVHVAWKPYDASLLPTEQLCSNVASPHPDHNYFQVVDTLSGETFQALSGHDFMYKEGPKTQSCLKTIHDSYDNDPFGPRTTSSLGAPPVKRVHAIHGINIPTEVGAFYRRFDACLSTKQSLPTYQLDPSPQINLTTNSKNSTLGDRYKVDGYLLKEVPTPDHPTGDGTVPYWSLACVQNWKGSVESLTVVELDQAEHREILGNKTFQKEVLRYCLGKQESV